MWEEAWSKHTLMCSCHAEERPCAHATSQVLEPPDVCACHQQPAGAGPCSPGAAAGDGEQMLGFMEFCKSHLPSESSQSWVFTAIAACAVCMVCNVASIQPLFGVLDTSCALWSHTGCVRGDPTAGWGPCTPAGHSYTCGRAEEKAARWAHVRLHAFCAAGWHSPLLCGLQFAGRKGSWEEAMAQYWLHTGWLDVHALPVLGMAIRNTTHMQHMHIMRRPHPH